MIPSAVQGQDNCSNAGTSVGATAVAECTKLQGLGAGTIIYYLFSSQGALNIGFNRFLTGVKFTRGVRRRARTATTYSPTFWCNARRISQARHRP
jgi:hypothetical protein